MPDKLIQSLVIVPFIGVPIALVAWAIFQFAVRKAPAKALVGLIAGAALCLTAFVLFFINIYCENCSDRPMSPRETTAAIAYFVFGLVMLLALWWSARSGKGSVPDKTRTDQDGE